MITEARDSFGKQVYASHAENHVRYKCPCCSIEVFLRKSAKGICHFVRFPGTEHKTEHCKWLSSAKLTHQLEGSDFIALMKNCKQISNSRVNTPDKQAENDDIDYCDNGYDSNESAVHDDDQEQVSRPFTKLSHIYTDRLTFRLEYYDTVQPGYTAEDIFLFPKWYRRALAEHEDGPKFRGGPRIAVLRVNKYPNWKELELRCHCSWLKDGYRERCDFGLRFKDKKAFNKFVKDHWVPVTTEKGTLEKEWNFSHVLVSADWKYHENAKGFEPKYVGDILSPRQIYCFTYENNK